MASGTRGIVAGWDRTNRRPKGVVSASDMRAAMSMLADRPGIAYGERDAQITLPDNAMAISWTAFNAVIPARGGGWYTPRISEGTQALSPGDASFPRIDVIWVRQHDYELDATHPDSEVEIGVSKGTPSATPAPSTIPTGALAVFTVKVPRGAVRGSDIGLAGVTRAPWAFPPAPRTQAGASTSRDITNLFSRVDQGGWIKDGGWTARLEGKTVTLTVFLHGPWQAANWRQQPLLSMDPSLKPVFPSGDYGVSAAVTTSTGGVCLLWVGENVRLDVHSANSWTYNAVSVSWNIA